MVLSRLMCTKLLWTLSIFVALALSARALAKEPVRAELTRLRTQSGLTLASYSRGIETVNFADRSLPRGDELLPVGAALEGSLSRDGAEIAIDLMRPLHGMALSIVRRDGSNLREFPEIAAPYGFCWSYDKSRLAMSVPNVKRGTTPPNDSLQILNLASKDTQVVDVRAYVTSQCWSPDGKKIAYDADDGVRVYDMEQKKWLVLAKGRHATWSPDGNWIAFLDDDTYYATSPSGDKRKELFKVKGALTGLWWSPDSRIVAYVSRNPSFEGPIMLDVGPVRLRVRRLDDNSED